MGAAPLHPEPTSPALGVPNTPPTNPSPEFTRNPVLLGPHCRQAACSAAPPPGPLRRCTTCTQRKVSPTGAFIHEDLPEPSILPLEAQVPAPHSSASSRLLAGGRGGEVSRTIQISNPSTSVQLQKKAVTLGKVLHLLCSGISSGLGLRSRLGGTVARNCHLLLAVVPLSLVPPLLPDGLFQQGEIHSFHTGQHPGLHHGASI